MGRGGQCKVYKVQCRKTNQFFAMRMLQKVSSSNRVQMEILVQQQLQHPNLLNLINTYLYSENLFMVVEYMDRKSLTQIAINQYKNINENILIYIIHEVLTGLKYIHKYGKIHRDIKSDNILINSQGNIKIADFGYAV